MIEAELPISPRNAEIKLTPKDEMRFWSKVNRRSLDECWEWTSSRNRCGYGQFRVGGKTVSAHRVAWVIAHGPIPAGEDFHGMCVLHRCDHRSCTNVSHLFLGTNLDNMRDMQSKGRGNNPRGDRHGSRLHPESRPRGDIHGSRLHPERMSRGEDHGRAKLTEEKVREIRVRYAAGGVTSRILSCEFGVSRDTIFNVIHRKNWKHIA